MVMSSYLTIVARVLMLNQMTFIQVLQELNIPSPLETILDIWILKMPLIGQPDKRKLLSMFDIYQIHSINIQSINCFKFLQV